MTGLSDIRDVCHVDQEHVTSMLDTGWLLLGWMAVGPHLTGVRYILGQRREPYIPEHGEIELTPERQKQMTRGFGRRGPGTYDFPFKSSQRPPGDGDTVRG